MTQPPAAYPDALWDIVRTYDVAGPRYTSYPTVPYWQELADDVQWRDAIANASQEPEGGIYVHIPFCEKRCLYCACNVIVAQDHRRADTYLDTVIREMDLAVDALGTGRKTSLLQFGGGTPTFLSDVQFTRILTAIRDRWPLADNAEVSVEVDPRVTTPAMIDHLVDLGVNRFSIGIQDFNPEVQAIVARRESEEEIAALVTRMRERQIASVNFDIIYGLPGSTLESLEKSLEIMLRLRPDRVAFYGYAHVPWVARHQKVLEKHDIPRGPDKLEMLITASRAFLDAGYEFIGMDHFALPDDPLAKARQEGSLQRTFQGYTTGHGTQVLGFGVSAISDTGRMYAQNKKDLPRYTEAINAGHLPIERGLAVTDEDVLRRDVIRRLMCLDGIDAQAIRDLYGVDLFTHFAREIQRLEPLTHDGLVEILPGEGIAVTPLGRLLVRTIAMVFDEYLAKKSSEEEDTGPRFSRTV